MLWGGQFKRLVGLSKASLYRTIGKPQLTWAELEVLLDRSITYKGEEIDYLILVPNSLIHGREVHFLQYLRKKKVKLWRNGISILNDVKKAYEKDTNMSIYWPLDKMDIVN